MKEGMKKGYGIGDSMNKEENKKLEEERGEGKHTERKIMRTD